MVTFDGVLQRLPALSQAIALVWAIDCAAFALLSNGYHVVALDELVGAMPENRFGQCPECFSLRVE